MIPLIVLDWDFDTFDRLDNGDLVLYDAPPSAAVVQIQGWISPSLGYAEPVYADQVDSGIYRIRQEE